MHARHIEIKLWSTSYLLWGFATSLVLLIVRRRRNVIRHNELCVSSIKAAIYLHFGHRRTENSLLI